MKSRVREYAAAKVLIGVPWEPYAEKRAAVLDRLSLLLCCSPSVSSAGFLTRLLLLFLFLLEVESDIESLDRSPEIKRVTLAYSTLIACGRDNRDAGALITEHPAFVATRIYDTYILPAVGADFKLHCLSFSRHAAPYREGSFSGSAGYYRRSNNKKPHTYCVRLYL